MSRDLVLREGARGVTVDRIVAASGTPKGSIYHRFSTVNDLLAAMWLRGVRRSQARFLEPLGAGGDPVEAAVTAGLAIHDFAREEPADAGLVAALRREDLVGAVLEARRWRRIFNVSTTNCTRHSPRWHDGCTAGPPETPSSGPRSRWSISRRGRSAATWSAEVPCRAMSVPSSPPMRAALPNQPASVSASEGGSECLMKSR